MPHSLVRSFERAKAILTPSLPDVFFPALVLALFSRPSAWLALLADGDTGWHIRTGEFILRSGNVPVRDLFSFSRPDAPWFAWEWLADVVFAASYRWHGLAAVAGVSAAVICFSGVLLLAWLLGRGAGFWIAAAVTLAVVNASSVHYLARPHVFSLLGFVLLLAVIDRDRRRPTRLVWGLVPAMALWTNLHGGFVAGLATLALLAAVSAAQRDRRAFGRYGSLTALAAAGTLLNPYGWRLHQHIGSYLGSSWILDSVQEFQSPSIRSESMLVFAVLLLAGVAAASRALARRQWFEGVLVMVWALAALRSARHIPLFALAVAPVMAEACAAPWTGWAARSSRRSVIRILWESGHDLGQFRRVGFWAPVLGGFAVCLALSQASLKDFPEARFPVAAIAHNLDRFERPARLLTSDQWGDYLIFRFYPRQRVFFDGRSDFYGQALGADYQVLLTAAHQWPEVLTRYGFEVALLPLDWPLAGVLEQSPQWQLVYRDKVAALLVKRAAPLKETHGNADCQVIGGSA